MSLLHAIALTCIPGIGTITARQMIAYCGGAEEVFSCSAQSLARIPGVAEKAARLCGKKEALLRAEKELLFIDRHGIRSFFIADADFPVRLFNCADAPIVIFFSGQANLNQKRIVSIVGTRNATDYGREICRYFIEELHKLEVLVVSGLAYGIDFIAHREACRVGLPTVGVLAHGLDRLYPSLHRGLADKMLENGGLLTEFLSGTIPDRENFPKRNRIIAGLADATVVIEAGHKGGALITADIANSYDREVFAFPGRVTDPFSAGCNKLIRTNQAHLITGVSDLEYVLGWNQDKKPRHRQLKLAMDLHADEQKVLEILKSGDLDIDRLAILAGQHPGALAAVLLNLEINGFILCLPGKVYRALHS